MQGKATSRKVVVVVVVGWLDGWALHRRDSALGAWCLVFGAGSLSGYPYSVLIKVINNNISKYVWNECSLARAEGAGLCLPPRVRSRVLLGRGNERIEMGEYGVLWEGRKGKELTTVVLSVFSPPAQRNHRSQ